MITIFDAPLTTSFQASSPVLMQDKHVALDFLIVVTVLAAVEWFLEFTGEDPNAAASQWYREIAEEDNGGGQTDMPIAVRTFRAAGGTNLPAGTHPLDAQFQKVHKFFRVQIRAASGTVTRTRIQAQFGSVPVSP